MSLRVCMRIIVMNPYALSYVPKSVQPYSSAVSAAEILGVSGELISVPSLPSSGGKASSRLALEGIQDSADQCIVRSTRL